MAKKKKTLKTKNMSFPWPCFHGKTQQQQYFYFRRCRKFYNQ